MLPTLTDECREILQTARENDARGCIHLYEVNGGRFIRVGRLSFGFAGDGSPDPRVLRRYLDALEMLVEFGYLARTHEKVYELTTKGWDGDLSDLDVADQSDDYLEMARHLYDKGYHHAAVMVAGAVLEDFLRRLHLTRLGPWPEATGSSISLLNDALQKAGVYEKSEWRRVQVWGDVRNNAAHGHFDKVDPGAAESMIAGIASFIDGHGT